MSFILLAQAAPPLSDDVPQGIVVLLIVLAVMAVPITGIIAGVKHAIREREMQHAERLKAIEKGIPLDDVEEERRFRKGIMWLALVIGGLVPTAAVTAAALAVANMSTSAVTNMTVFLIWTGAAAVGVAGVASGAWLAQAAIARLNPASRRSLHTTDAHPRSYEAQEAVVGR